MTILNQQEIGELVGALIHSDLDVGVSRGALFQFINPQYKALLPTGLPVAQQLLSDLGLMNARVRLANGDIPLAIYLRNAVLLLGETGEAVNVVRTMLNRVVQRTSGAGPIERTQLPELKERLVHTDDTVTFAFMEAGVRAGAAVAKLRVPRFENGLARVASGAPVIYLGTGWIIAPGLLITNHHVINARNDGEPHAADADWNLQARAAIALFGFDADGLAGVEVPVQGAEAWDAALDYVVLRIPASAIAPLRCAARRVDKASGAMPVNIIQHPAGRSKRYGIRNNLVSGSTPTELRYFTDTEAGSSGSPVLDDRWEVVALHRASAYVEDVQFQGKPTAYVNVGTHMRAILEDLAVRSPALAAEIAAGPRGPSALDTRLDGSQLQ